MNRLLIIFSFMLTSCLSTNTNALQEIELKISSEWLYAYSLENFRINGSEIDRPPGITQLLFKLLLPSEGGLSVKSHCVYYQVPYKKIQGKLQIVELKSNSECPFSPPANLWIELDQMSKLKINFENFKLILSFEISRKIINWSFILPNIEGTLEHTKYSPVKEKRWRSGLSFLRSNSETFLIKNNKYLGKISDRMSRGEVIRCEQVDKDCNIIGEDRCDECRFGWYQVVDYNCPQGGSRFCGQNHCGEKGEPACPRGSKVVSSDQLGICQNDLTPVWNADHILICQ